MGKLTATIKKFFFFFLSEMLFYMLNEFIIIYTNEIIIIIVIKIFVCNYYFITSTLFRLAKFIPKVFIWIRDCVRERERERDI